ncbi:MAG: hypothetical protein CMO13_00765 [Thaumarchaeota archaeon]|nr:hypothetical protein [Nitrososphaerota archaeon]
MGIKDILIPQETKFFDLLEELSSQVRIASIELGSVFDNSNKLSTIEDLEHEGDRIVHEIYTMLDKSFITPIDREDISKLTILYDDVLDAIWDVTNRMHLMRPVNKLEYMTSFPVIIEKSVSEIDNALKLIRVMDRKTIEKHVINVHTYENQADNLHDTTLSEIFQLDDVKELLKHKEILEKLEKSVDYCEDVADVLRDVVTKYS